MSTSSTPQNAISVVVAEREFEFEPVDGGERRAVIVRVGQPQRGAVDWFAPYEIEGPNVGRIYRQVAWGVDPMQALLEAIWIVPVHLSLLATQNQGRLLYLGEEDVNMYRPPPPWIPVPWRRASRPGSRLRPRGGTRRKR